MMRPRPGPGPRRGSADVTGITSCGTSPAAREAVVVTGVSALSGCGRGVEALSAAVSSGTPAFVPVTRFDTSRRMTTHAAELPGAPALGDELVAAVEEACREAGLTAGDAARAGLLLAIHSDLRIGAITAEVAQGVAERSGLPGIERVYTCACVAASTALADAAALISAGARERIVVAAGYLVEPDTFGVFDAGRALARDGRARPFSRYRSGLLLGDAVAAVVLESARAAGRRGAIPLARLAGWGRAGDAYHVCRPIPDGSGLARAIESALGRAGVEPGAVGYVNANATGSPLADTAEANALRTVFGADGGPAVSSTKSVHGHALEASALLEFAVTVLALRDGVLPVNGGYLGPAEDCRLDLVLERPRQAEPGYALTVNCAFGGANTALLVGAA
jgi:3-oxoacyl-[acyl-carrier-protein] synthase II